MSDFTLGVVNVWGGECLGGERLTIQLITKKTTSSTSIFRNDHPFLPTTIQPQNTIISSFSSSFKILSSVQKVGWLEGVNLGTAIL